MHQCPECPKAFAKQSKLDRHLISHSGEKPFKCDVCFQTFGRKDHLQRHSLQHKTSLVERKPFECTACFNRFANKHHLVRHTTYWCKVLVDRPQRVPKPKVRIKKTFECCEITFDKWSLFQSHLSQHSRTKTKVDKKPANKPAKRAKLTKTPEASETLLPDPVQAEALDIITAISGFNHPRTDPNRPLACLAPDCAYRFKRKYDLFRHFKSRHLLLPIQADPGSCSFGPHLQSNTLPILDGILAFD